MAELKACPFCGGEAHTYRNNFWWVACERAKHGCVMMGAFLSEEEAVAAWNRRAVSELKTCPFCGSGVLYEARHTVDWFDMPFMFCDTCKSMFTVEGSEDWIHGDHDGMDELRAAWNRRA